MTHRFKIMSALNSVLEQKSNTITLSLFKYIKFYFFKNIFNGMYKLFIRLMLNDDQFQHN